MDKETQNIEFKQSWHDEYLEWICGYANANGGILYIGRKDDGTPCGVAKSKSLMESIPCKITDSMGIIADVNLLEQDGKDVIEIKVDRYPSLISYRGKYFYRSGTTMRTISGKELDRLILKQLGMTWDSVPIPKISADDLDETAIRYFKDEAVRRNRLSLDEVDVSRAILLENLKLVDEDSHIMRAAMLAFHKDPEKWVFGSYVKIGYFEQSDSDLRYQDEVHGPLILQADKVVDLVYTKYLKALISYEGIHRREQFMFSRDAFREIVLNAIVHKDYSSLNPIQISVYPDKIYIWNDGIFPVELNTEAKLYGKHSSKPFNPHLAGIFFKCGLIEAWGRGFDKITAGCKDYNGPLPSYDISASGVMVLCKACPAYLDLMNGGSKPDTAIAGKKDNKESSKKSSRKTILKTTLNTTLNTTLKIKQLMEEYPTISIPKIASELGISIAGVNWNIKRMKESGSIQRVGPDKGGHWEVLNP